MKKLLLLLSALLISSNVFAGQQVTGKLAVFGNVGIGTGSASSYVTSNPPAGGLIVQGNVGVGTIDPATKLEVSGTIKTTGFQLSTGASSGYLLTTNSVGVGTWMPPAVLPAAIPSGVIALWSGTIASIPSGWVLCNGSNGTPDLRNRFIVAADADDGGIAKSTVTGSALQTSDGQIPAHTHTVSTRVAAAATGVLAAAATGSATDSSTTSSFGTGTKNIAVFYALAYIMKT